MMSRRDGLSAAAAAAGSVTGCWAVLATPPTDLLVAERDSSVSSAFLNPAWAGVVAILAALAVIGVAAWFPRRGVVGVTGLLGSAVLVSPAVVDVSTALSVSVTGLGAGLLLAASALLARQQRGIFVALVLGAVAGYRFVEWAAQRPTDEFRWSVGLPGDPFYPEPVVPVIVLVVCAVLFASVITVTLSDVEQHERSWGIAAAALAVWVAYSFLGDYTASVGHWAVAAGLTVVVIACAAVVCGRDGAFVCAGLAVGATSVGSMAWNAWWLVPLAALGLAAGAVCAWRAPSVPVGCTVLAVICASTLVPYSTFSTITYAVVLPVAIAYTLLSCAPTNPAVTAAGLLLPTMLCVFSLSAPPAQPYTFGWTSATPGDEVSVSDFDPGVVGAFAVAVAVATCAAVLTAGIAVVCSRRGTATGGRTAS
ncbi:hypothetical protein [Rhodococcus sp. IEGM 1381]|uniref:hypothetical protein n=1 Tax=Rhodococcus sp. IEGM 1381 TaxID=3047085 RepID=UPI0032D58CF1